VRLCTTAETRAAVGCLVLMWIPGKAMFALQNSYAKAQFGWGASEFGGYYIVVCATGILATHFGSRLRGRAVPCTGGGGGGGGGDQEGGDCRRGRLAFADGALLLLSGLAGAASCAVYTLGTTARWFYAGGAVYGLSVLLNPTFRALLARAAPAGEQAGVLGSVGALEIAVQMVAPELLRPAFDGFDRVGWAQGYYAVCGCIFLVGMCCVSRCFPIFGVLARATGTGAEEGKRRAGEAVSDSAAIRAR